MSRKAASKWCKDSAKVCKFEFVYNVWCFKSHINRNHLKRSDRKGVEGCFLGLVPVGGRQWWWVCFQDTRHPPWAVWPPDNTSCGSHRPSQYYSIALAPPMRLTAASGSLMWPPLICHEISTNSCKQTFPDCNQNTYSGILLRPFAFFIQIIQLYFMKK